jgi:hypothetical protein
MADYYGLKLCRQFNTSFECSLAKIRQQNVGKNTVKTSKIPGERLMVDISLVRSPSFGGEKFWIMVLDDCTDMCWSIFCSSQIASAGASGIINKEVTIRSTIPNQTHCENYPM